MEIVFQYRLNSNNEVLHSNVEMSSFDFLTISLSCRSSKHFLSDKIDRSSGCSVSSFIRNVSDCIYERLFCHMIIQIEFPPAKKSLSNNALIKHYAVICSFLKPKEHYLDFVHSYALKSESTVIY